MKGLIKVISVLRTVIKYAAIILIVVDIVQYAIDKLQAYAASKQVEGDKTDPQ